MFKAIVKLLKANKKTMSKFVAKGGKAVGEALLWFAAFAGIDWVTDRAKGQSGDSDEVSSGDSASFLESLCGIFDVDEDSLAYAVVSAILARIDKYQASPHLCSRLDNAIGSVVVSDPTLSDEERGLLLSVCPVLSEIRTRSLPYANDSLASCVEGLTRLRSTEVLADNEVSQAFDDLIKNLRDATSMDLGSDPSIEASFSIAAKFVELMAAAA